MIDKNLNRRDLCRLAFAALGGITAGAMAGCGGSPSSAPASTAKAPDKQSQSAEATNFLLDDLHICRGINTCKNKGKKGTTNECAGQAHCATVSAHDCSGMNDCKGQGGCGEHPGDNACKGKGGCEVPLSDKTWPKGADALRNSWPRPAKKLATLRRKANQAQ